MSGWQTSRCSKAFSFIRRSTRVRRQRLSNICARDYSETTTCERCQWTDCIDWTDAQPSPVAANDTCNDTMPILVPVLLTVIIMPQQGRIQKLWLGGRMQGVWSGVQVQSPVVAVRGQSRPKTGLVAELDIFWLFDSWSCL